MTDADWTAVAAIGQIASAVATAFGLPFVGYQIWLGRKATDLQSLQAFNSDTQRCEHAFDVADVDQSKVRAFRDLLNHLELYAAALNDGLLNKTSTRFVESKLCDAIALIEASPRWLAALEESVTNEQTFDDMATFRQRHATRIKSLASEFRKS